MDKRASKRSSTGDVRWSRRSYLEKHALYPSMIDTAPEKNLFNIIVIPCYNEPEVERTLLSLLECDKPKLPVEVIVIVNSSEELLDNPVGEGDDIKILEQNLESIESIKLIQNDCYTDSLKIHYIHIDDFPRKHAGVGLARKVGMDEAVRRFELISEEQNILGVITCLDADCLVESNYLVAIENHFLNNENCPAVSIKYEHDIDSHLLNRSKICDYELHLRYYNQALLYAGFPFAYHTVGSSMAVQYTSYQLQGGMNKRKAGEDFYFLQKFIQLDGFAHIGNTKVIPSSRDSDRVPFGTGRAMMEMGETYSTYPLDAFSDMKVFVDSISYIYESRGDVHLIEKILPVSVFKYLIENGFAVKISEIYGNTNSLESFRRRFFNLINAFWLMKYLNNYRNVYGASDVFVAANELYSIVSIDSCNECSASDLLIKYRMLDRE